MAKTYSSYLPLSFSHTHTQLDISNCGTFKIEYYSSHDPITSSFFIINPLSILFLSLSLFLSFILSPSLSMFMYYINAFSLCVSLSFSLACSLLALCAESHGHCGHVCNQRCVLRERQELVIRERQELVLGDAGASTWRSRPRARGWGRA